ncbi:hypothetical protein WMY93_031141 [Mugilogobius chulae]|uniref:Centromere protein P n=1 Tax=Mugilogobius chulae TaxID=88201 RepID=A0AAW0ME43_9GOBI
MEAELEAELQKLQAEVTDLEKQLQDQRRVMDFDFRGNLLHTLGVVCSQSAVPMERQMLALRLQEEVDELEEDLKRQTQMNGIRVVSCRRRREEESLEKKAVAERAGGSISAQRVCVSGVCSELSFQVEFKLSELKFGSRTKQTLSDLNIVMEESDLQSFSSFLSRVEESQDLLLFFRTLRTFCERCDERRRTFAHLQTEHPSIVSLPEGQRSEVMTLSLPQLPGCVLLVHWSVQVNKEGGVKSSVELLPKIPENALQLFQSSPVAGAAEAFHSLQRILGVEGALETVVMAMSHDQ